MIYHYKTLCSALFCYMLRELEEMNMFCRVNEPRRHATATHASQWIESRLPSRVKSLCTQSHNSEVALYFSILYSMPACVEGIFRNTRAHIADCF